MVQESRLRGSVLGGWRGPRPEMAAYSAFIERCLSYQLALACAQSNRTFMSSDLG